MDAIRIVPPTVALQRAESASEWAGSFLVCNGGTAPQRIVAVVAGSGSEVILEASGAAAGEANPLLAPGASLDFAVRVRCAAGEEPTVLEAAWVFGPSARKRVLLMCHDASAGRVDSRWLRDRAQELTAAAPDPPPAAMFAIGRQKPGAAGSARAAMHKDAVPGSGRPRSRSPIVMSPVVAGGDTLTQLRRAMRSSVLSSAARSAVDPADKPSALRPGAPLGARAPPTAVSPSAAARPATPPRGGLAPSRAADAASLSAGVRPHSSRSRLASSHRVASSRGRPAAPGVAEAVRTSMGGPPGGALRGGCEAPTAAAPVAAPGAARPDGDAAFFGRLLGIEVPPPGGAPSRPGSSGRRGRGAAAPGRRGVGVGAAAASSGVDDGAAPGLGGADDMLGGAPRTARLETGAVGAADDDEASEFLDIVGGLLAGAAAGLDAELAAPFDVSDDDEEAWLGAHSGAAGPGAAAPAAPSAAASGSAGARATGPVHGQTTLSGLARSSSPLRGSIRPKRRQPAASASPAGADPAGTGRAQRAVAVATVGTGAAERAARRKATAGAAGGSRAMVKPGQRIRVTVPSAASLRKRA